MVDIPNQARLRGVDLLGRPVDDVLNDLNVIGVKILRDTDGAILPEEGISLYVVGANVESVTVGYPPIAKA